MVLLLTYSNDLTSHNLPKTIVIKILIKLILIKDTHKTKYVENLENSVKAGYKRGSTGITDGHRGSCSS